MAETILLVDGHSIANRAFYGLPPMSNSKGVPTNAIYGFINILSRTAESVQATQMAVAFDEHAPTFRHEIYPEYKGTRKPMPDDLRAQIPLIRSYLETIGVQVISHPGLEADDILGTTAKRMSAEHQVYILSGDRDLLQLTDAHIRIIMPTTHRDGTETKIYDEAAVRETMGVSPAEYLQCKALMGDTSDNIPGVPSIGPKTASSIISQYHDLESAIEAARADLLKPKAACAKLKEFADQARFSLLLATIKTDADFPERPAPFRLSQFGCPEAIELYKQYEFRSLLTRFVHYLQEYETPEQETVRSERSTACCIVRTDDDLEAMTRAMQSGFSFEFFEEKDEGLLGFWGLAVSTGGKNWWVEEDFMLREPLLMHLKALLEDPEIPKSSHDVKQEIMDLMDYGIRLDGLCMDSLIGAYLLNPLKENYTPSELSGIFLNESVRSEEEIFGSGKSRRRWTSFTAEERARIGTEQTEIILRTSPLLEQELKSKDMWTLYTEIERPLIFVLADMEKVGIRVDTGVLREFGETISVDIERLSAKIQEEAGQAFNILSPKQLGEILFEKLGLPAGKKTKSGYSTSADILEKLAPDYAIVRDVLQYRQLTKLKSTYVEGMMPFIGPDGKIHCHFNQTVAATGRLSSSDPNLQNIPIRTHLGRLLRKAFVPSDDGWILIDADYSQIELRLLAHMAADENMIRSYREGHDIHRMTASQVLGKRPEDITDAERSGAKAVSFGIIYGISAFSLSDDLHISQKEAKAYIDRYYRQFPRVRGYLDSCVADARELGYAVTLFGRRRPMDELKSTNFIQRSFGERVARNMPIQGTAADIMKIAMVRVAQRLRSSGMESRILVTVHDELLIETRIGEEERVRTILQEEMASAAQLSVPLDISVSEGSNWYEAK